MPQTLAHPGVYIEETPSSVRTIVGVATSITAFIGAAPRGPVDTPVRIANFGDYSRRFGGLSRSSPMSYSVAQYFMNGGADAIIVRVQKGGVTAKVILPAGVGGSLTLEADSVGDWGNQLRVMVEDSAPAFPGAFNLTIREVDLADPTVVLATEIFLNLTTTPGDKRYVGTILDQESALASVLGAPPTNRPTAVAFQPFVGGSDSVALTDAELSAAPLRATKSGLYALEKADLFNLLCIPPLTLTDDIGSATHNAALSYARERRAVYLLDAPGAWSSAADPVNAAETGFDALVTKLDNGAIYFPRIMAPDPLQENRLASFAPSGAVAGVIARTDATRGVWKAPAGTDATLVGVPQLAVKMTDAENGRLNKLGIDCLRSFPVIGNIVWGGRTLRGADALADQWKYLPIRRTAYFIEETLYRATQWVVFEPNDEPLWAQIRLNIGAFMQGLFEQQAFQGKTPKEAYLVKCDRETNPQRDIDKGVVNIIVGFAPLKPAEFVLIKLQQLAGQVAS
ncbi:phage tail sheath subtilisin-like domain-containing protein [Sphingomonas sp. LB-2]|uniref:phage tail sheath family protein n=1 Tax=Sphingomonas caeni TaxID=2984949 RepID=UPI0022324C22|nr:phage tail sheath C-terminal domain-containing protein [Sphingomonas caeni]MCW3846507.1 phage tail sheath subtilisin-like domain-containing protein [Sphingomonas caeni]